MPLSTNAPITAPPGTKVINPTPVAIALHSES
jgi:hypothetical protein